MHNIDCIVRTPMEALRFRDFVNLKSGRDSWSAMRLDTLRELVAIHDVHQIADEWPHDEREQARCLRWIVRGLPLDKAIRKVRTDAEVRDNAISARHAA